MNGPLEKELGEVKSELSKVNEKLGEKEQEIERFQGNFYLYTPNLHFLLMMSLKVIFINNLF